MSALAPATGILLAFCVAAEVAYQLCFKSAAQKADPVRFAASVAGNWVFWLGIVLWAAEFVSWVLALQQAPLTLAYPVMALTYVGVPLAGVFLLRETMTKRGIAGAGLVVVGVACISMAGA